MPTKHLLPVVACLIPFVWPLTTNAKPISICVDHAFDQCAWAAEAQILAVGEEIKVRVTSDPDAVYRGHQHLGQELTVRPFQSGPHSCRHDLSQLSRESSSILLVVSKQGQLQMAGLRAKLNDAPGYHLRGWCDFNAVMFYTKDKSFGQHVGERFAGRYGVTQQQIAGRFVPERKRMVLALAEILSRPPADLEVDAIRATIAQLGDEEFQVREEAQQKLSSLDESAAELLLNEADSATDPEIRVRLLATAHRLQSPLHRHATKLRTGDPSRERQVLNEALEVLSTAQDPELKKAVVLRLELLRNSH